MKAPASLRIVVAIACLSLFPACAMAVGVNSAWFTNSPLIGTVYVDSNREFGMLEDADPPLRDWYRNELVSLAAVFKSNMPTKLAGFAVKLSGNSGRCEVTPQCPQAVIPVQSSQYCGKMLSVIQNKLNGMAKPPDGKNRTLYIVIDPSAGAVSMWADDIILRSREHNYTQEQLDSVSPDRLKMELTHLAASRVEPDGPALVGSVEYTANPLPGALKLKAQYEDPRPEWRKWYRSLFVELLKAAAGKHLQFADFDITVHGDGYVVAKSGGTEKGAAVDSIAKALTGRRTDLQLPKGTAMKHLTVPVVFESGEIVMWSRDPFLSHYADSRLAAIMVLDEQFHKKRSARIPPNITEATQVHHEPGDSIFTYTLEDPENRRRMGSSWVRTVMPHRQSWR